MRPDHTVTSNAGSTGVMVSHRLARNALVLRAFVSVCRDQSMTKLFRLLRSFVLPAVLVATAFVAAPSRAAVDDVLKEIQRDGQARVLLRMKADGGGVAWAPRLSASRQRVAVATAFHEATPALQRAGIAHLRTFRTLPYVAATVDRDQVLALMTEDAVAGIYLIRRERRAEITGTARPQAAAISAALANIDVSGAWDKGFDGTGTSVAVIDSGINVNHPALRGKNIGDACFANIYVPTTISQCFSGQDLHIGSGAASNCPEGSSACDHGTQVASIAVGSDETFSGVARGAKLVPINVFVLETDPSECGPDPAPCYLTDSLAVLNALDYINQHAIEYKIAAVNLSIGGSERDGYCDDDPRKAVIDMLRQKGIGVAVAAGNGGLTGSVYSPACISSAVAVGATDNGTTVAALSNFAATVDLMAPGLSVLGALGSGSGYGPLDGTSMAVPQVAGAWAILRQAFPTLSADAIEAALKTTGTPVTRANSGVTVAKLQIAAALTKLQGADRRLFNNVFATNAGALGQSLLRFFNESGEVGNVKVTLRDGVTGALVGDWISPPVPARAALQFGVVGIVANATKGGFPLAPDPRTYFNVEVLSSFKGAMQHVVWSPQGGVLTNLTHCGALPFADTPRQLINVHSSAIAEYPSRVRVMNSGVTAATVTLSFYNAVTGEKLADWVTPEISSSGAFEVAVPAIEAVVPALGDAAVEGTAHYNVVASNFSGYLQHVVENMVPGALIDMTATCALAPGALSVAVPAP